MVYSVQHRLSKVAVLGRITKTAEVGRWPHSSFRKRLLYERSNIIQPKNYIQLCHEPTALCLLVEKRLFFRLRRFADWLGDLVIRDRKLSESSSKGEGEEKQQSKKSKGGRFGSPSLWVQRLLPVAWLARLLLVLNPRQQLQDAASPVVWLVRLTVVIGE